MKMGGLELCVCGCLPALGLRCEGILVRHGSKGYSYIALYLLSYRCEQVVNTLWFATLFPHIHSISLRLKLHMAM